MLLGISMLKLHNICNPTICLHVQFRKACHGLELGCHTSLLLLLLRLEGAMLRRSLVLPQ